MDMKIEQMASHLSLAVNAMMGMEGVISVATSAGVDKVQVHVVKSVFDSIPATTLPGYAPCGEYSGQIKKEVNGINFFTLVTDKEFAELYPNYLKGAS